jgi:putative nucleotidyltransferase with HDIG domain
MTISSNKVDQESLSKAQETIQTLFSFIEAQGQSDYIGEEVSQLEHSLQTAALAADAGSDDHTVLAALLHDVGRFIPPAKGMPPMIAADGTYVGNESHEVLGEKYLRGLGFSEDICEIVGAHVWAKRYLCATEKGYWDSLSKSSKITLEFQVSSATHREPGSALTTATGWAVQ